MTLLISLEHSRGTVAFSRCVGQGVWSAGQLKWQGFPLDVLFSSRRLDSTSLSSDGLAVPTR